MTNKVDPVDLARELAEIARTTTDPETGRRLAELVKRLLAAAGLPPDDEAGGGEVPTEWVHQIAEFYGQPLTPLGVSVATGFLPRWTGFRRWRSE